MDKRNINFKASLKLLEDFDKTLKDYEDVSGLSLKKGNCLEIAMRDYIIKLKKNIETLKSINP